jgi:hypothetical protein
MDWYSNGTTNYLVFAGGSTVALWRYTTNPFSGTSITTNIGHGIVDIKIHATGQYVFALTPQAIYRLPLDMSSSTQVYSHGGVNFVKLALGLDHSVYTSTSFCFYQIQNTWPNEQVNANHVCPSGVSRILGVAYDPANDLVYYFGNNGNVYRISNASTSFGLFLQSETLCVGNINTAVDDVQRNSIYFFTNLGVFCEVNHASFMLTRIGIVPNALPLSFSTIDELHDTLFVSSTNNGGTLYRIDLSDFSVFDYFSAQASYGPLVASNRTSLIPQTQIFWGATSSPVVIAVVQPAACNYGCFECAQDPEYCVYCAAQRNCTFDFQCPTYTGTSNCPILQSVSPSSGSTAGGTLITLLGTFYEGNDIPINASRIQCSIDGQLVPAVNATSTTASCFTPPHPNQTQPTEAVNVTAFVDGSLWMERPVTFTYYRCDLIGTTCATCLQESECGICLSTSGCTALSQCLPQNAITRTCPTIVSVVPDSAPIIQTQNITVTVTPFLLSDFSYICQFGNITQGLVTGTIISNNQLVCPTPILNSTYFMSLTSPQPDWSTTLTVRIVNNSQGYAPYQGFLFYNCPMYQACAQCATVRTTQCEFCFDSQTCAYVNNMTSCKLASQTYACPGINQIQPPSVYIADVSKTTLNVLGSFDVYLNGTLANLTCAWDAESAQVALTTITPTVVVNTTYIRCSVLSSLGVGIHELSIWQWTTPPTILSRVTLDYSFIIYNCSGSPCSDCLDDYLRPQCMWCNADHTCKSRVYQLCANNATAVWRQSDCPVLYDAVPDTASLQGGNIIELFGNFSLQNVAGSLLQCSFQTSGGVIATNTLMPPNNTVVQCPAAPSAQAFNGFVQLIADNVSYTDTTNFTWYDCTQLTGPCDQCLAPNTSACQWCGDSCAFSCPNSFLTYQDGCPVLLEVIPDHGYYTGGETIYIRGGPWLGVGLPEFQYQCYFGDAVVNAEIVTVTYNNVSEQQVACVTPPGLGSTALTVKLNYQTYAVNSLNFTFFQCNTFSEVACSAVCLSQQYCGWCVGTSQCIPQNYCNNTLWLSSCFAMNVTPSYMDTQPGGLPVTATFAPALPLSILNNTQWFIQNQTAMPLTKKRSELQTSDFACQWTAQNLVLLTTAAEVIAQNTVVCYPNAIIPPQTSYMSVLWKGANLATPVPFLIVGCSTQYYCGDCKSVQYCGWCLEENNCSTSAQCYARQNTWIASDCPSLTSLNPAVGFGGEKIVVIGTHFINNSLISVMFGEQSSNATFVNTSMLTTIAPPGQSGDTVNVSLYYANKPYTINSLQFVYINSNVALAAGLSVAAAAILIAGAIVLFLWLRKRRKQGIVIDIQEPDYVKVAFQSQLERQYKVTVKDNYKLLEDLLMSRDRTLLRAIVAITIATEYDAVARSLVYLSHHHGQSVDLIRLFTLDEVRRSSSENTIFRQNSIASKMFKFYSQLVGTKYLFFTLGRVVNEINTVAARSIAKDGEESGPSLLTINMEVDPDKVGQNENVDTDQNVYQLALACQKIFSVIIRSVDKVPLEFRQIFVSVRDSVREQFGEASDSHYKALGGFFFLRFICPAITAPHYYGLLPSPPNAVAQRQLVLIAKVLQNLANMSHQTKEKFMQKLRDFINRNVPKMRHFYNALLNPALRVNQKMQMSLTVPDEVRENALAFMYTHIYRNEAKLKAVLKEIQDIDKSLRLITAVDEVIQKYGQPPKNLKVKEKEATKGNAEKAEAAQ